jgi:branched-subunit amino acid aminotransferase/4-amino-4-deoxychorismate lyase
MYVVSYNNQLTPINQCPIPVQSEGFMYGYGLFETVKVLNAQPCLLKEHIHRLNQGCKILDLKQPYPLSTLKTSIQNLLKANHINNGVLKILCFKNKNRSELLITTKHKTYPNTKAYSVCFCTTPRTPSALTQLKTMNYLENILAQKQAKEQGSHEILFLNQNQFLCEGAISNLFFVKDHVIHTPSIQCGLLPGIIRAEIIRLAKTNNLKLQTGKYTKTDLFNADETFLTNSLIGIMPISKIEHKTWNPKKFTITKTLTTVLMNTEHDEL